MPLRLRYGLVMTGLVLSVIAFKNGATLLCAGLLVLTVAVNFLMLGKSAHWGQRKDE